MRYDHEYYLQWIISDYTPFEYAGRKYYLSTPCRQSRFLAEQIYHDIYIAAIGEGLLTQDDLLLLLDKYGLWDGEKEEMIKKLETDTEEIKVQIFNNYFKSNSAKALKITLRDTHKLISKLSNERSTFDNFSARAIALYAKQHFLIGSSIYRKNKPLYQNDWWSLRDDSLLNYAYTVLANYSLQDNEYRLLARSLAWRNVWNSRKGANIFGRASVDLSIAQKHLIMWSQMYDNVYKNPDCPVDAIIEDDDALDGWFILQKRKRDRENNQNQVESQLSPKVQNSEEIYILCDPADTQKIMDCNDFEAKLRWKSRMNQIKKEGFVREQDMIDRKRELQMQMNRRQYV